MSELSVLGQSVAYVDRYDPGLLEAIPRQQQRQGFVLAHPLPFEGQDCWRAYELSWLAESGKPEVRVAQVTFDADSPAMVESKALKLYFNSFNQTTFASEAVVLACITADLSRLCGCDVEVVFFDQSAWCQYFGICEPPGVCLDDLTLDKAHYEVDPQLLQLSGKDTVHQQLYSHLLKTNCPVTGQPDWATVLIEYQGSEIDPVSLLSYLISYRNHGGFHEHCVEQIFVDLLALSPEIQLMVQGCFTRRGGIDITPWRRNCPRFTPFQKRTFRQ